MRGKDSYTQTQMMASTLLGIEQLNFESLDRKIEDWQGN
jgi:hypothetical protein